VSFWAYVCSIASAVSDLRVPHRIHQLGFWMRSKTKKRQEETCMNETLFSRRKTEPIIAAFKLFFDGNLYKCVEEKQRR